jgi:integrase
MERSGDGFVCRVVVPKSLRLVVGRTELTRSLGSDRREALRLLPIVDGEFATIIRDARAGLSPAKVSNLVVRPLSPSQMARAHYAEQIAFDDELRAQDYRYARFGLIDARDIKALREIAAGAATDAEIDASVGWIIRKFRSRGNTDAASGSAEWRSLARALASAELEALARTMERDEGDLDGEPKAKILALDPAPLVAAVPSPAGFIKVPVEPVSLRKLFDDYLRELLASGKGRSLSTRWLPSIDRLIAFVRHDDATRLTKNDVVRWKDDLVAEGSALKTVRDVHLAALKAVLRWAVDNARIESNPAESVRVKVPVKRRSREQGFTDDEAKAILKVARDYVPDGNGHPSKSERPWTVAAKRWIPWLCALTGARVGEMVQLRKEDVRERDGVSFLRLTPEAGTIKSGDYRDVPLHPQLIEMGFLAFAAGEPDGPLFYERDTVRDVNEVRQQIVSVLGKWIRSLNIVDSEVSPNHGWRHRFKTVSREIGIDPRVTDAIQGHSGRTAGEDYGDVTVKARKIAIDRMPFYVID